jgi:hypothetical protein
MINHNISAALIIGHRRYENVIILIEILKKQEFKKIYIAIDPSSASDSNSSFDVNKTIEVSLRAKSVMPEVIQVAVHSENVGCSAAVLSACEWFFENEEFGLVFEDDCIPSDEFFTFANHSRQIINCNEDAWLFCGTQFAPESISKNCWDLSKYALIWGWGTTREKWNQIASAIRIRDLKIQGEGVSFAEKQYWDLGARRSSSGIVDAWDNVLIQRMLSLGKKALLPRYALVTNIGNDSAATHTIGESPWLGIQTGSFTTPTNNPLENPILDSWLLHNFYKISSRHVLTTRITRILDFIMMRKRKVVNLVTRWENARKNLSLFQ